MLQKGIKCLLWLFLYPVIDNQYLYPVPCNNCTHAATNLCNHKQNPRNDKGRAYNSVKPIPASGLSSWHEFYTRENTGVKEKQRKIVLYMYIYTY